MTSTPASSGPSAAGPAPGVPGDPPGPGRRVSGGPAAGEAGRGDDSDVDVLYLAGQRPSAPGGEWLLITGVDGTPGAEFTAQVLPTAGRHAAGGDVLVHLAAEPVDLVSAGVWAVIGGHLVPVAQWDRHEPEGWPETIRATTAFAMGILARLEMHGADLAASQQINLDEAMSTATPGLPLHITFPGGTTEPMMP